MELPLQLTVKPEPHVLLVSTLPAASAALHASLTAGQTVRSYAAVHFEGPAPDFSDIRTVPAALPPLPNAGGMLGGRPSFAARQGGHDFVFDYGLAFNLRQADAFTRSGFGCACIGSTCHGKNPIYVRGREPFIWERKRNRGGALICPGAGGHLLCLRCVEAEYDKGRPFVTAETGNSVSKEDLVTKFEVFPDKKEMRQVQSGEAVEEGGHQFFVQRRDLASCPHCTEPKGTSRRGVKRALEEGPAPSELGSMGILLELKGSKVPPTAIAPGLFLVPQIERSKGRLLDITVTERGLVNAPRLVKVDHTGKFMCLCGQRGCRDHEVGFLEETRRMDDWWQGGVPNFAAFEESRPFAREITSNLPWVLPVDQSGRIGAVLTDMDAAAWRGGRQVRIFVLCDEGEQPILCVQAGEIEHCSHVDCRGLKRCRHLLRLLTEPQPLGSSLVAAEKGQQKVNEKRAERLSQREAGARWLLVCNHPVCRRPGFKAACTHQDSLEPWKCLPAAALDTGHSHKHIDTVMSRGGATVMSLCERWGAEGVRQRNEAQHFFAPRPSNPLAPCGRPWKLESRKGSLTTAGARYEVTTFRRVCRIAPGREAACCSLAYDGLFTNTEEMSLDCDFDELVDIEAMSKKQALNMLYGFIVRGSWGRARISNLKCCNEDAPRGESDDYSDTENSDGEDRVDDLRPDSEIVKDFFPDSRSLDAFVSMMTSYKKDLATFCAEYNQSQEDGIFNFSGTTLISHGLLLRNHYAAALGAAHSLNFEANDMAARCLEGPSVPRLDDRVFDSAMQAFNVTSALKPQL
ncbi:hypothetical protein KFL_015070010 [Klebsormidium nitens]|uniref:Uncharacterized protein n=1 Tax=Klebsormidium nitens TaxID=105231 RepID=A0A1Y1IRD0_KLENI|nr:hypothetical protein KFL_015070010 [Klebsormidium nitens]|eukprot:GAQ93410.1 hypothetical protein KFL_015070010 [Klebsormidium nitens]